MKFVLLKVITRGEANKIRATMKTILSQEGVQLAGGEELYSLETALEAAFTDGVLTRGQRARLLTAIGTLGEAVLRKRAQVTLPGRVRGLRRQYALATEVRDVSVALL